MFKILVVEDDKDLNRSVCSFLNQNSYEATGCLNAGDAYDAMYEAMFDLIISDIMMPEIDGYEFAKTVRSLNAEIPILFMTAKDDILSMQKSYRIGIWMSFCFALVHCFGVLRLPQVIGLRWEVLLWIWMSTRQR